MEKIVDNEIEKGNAAYSIISYNLCNGSSLSNLNYQGSQDERMQATAELLISSNPDVIALQEYAPAHCEDLIIALEMGEYRLYYPEGFSKQKDRRKTAITILAVKDDISFEQEFVSGIELSYRYIAGTLKKYGEKDVKLFATHIPQLGDCSKATIRRKSEMLLETYKYFTRATLIDRKECLLIGDFNGILEKSHSSVTEDHDVFAKIAKDAIDTSLKKEATFKKARLDYCFINAHLNKDYTVKTYEKDTAFSDHRYLVVEMKKR